MFGTRLFPIALVVFLPGVGHAQVETATISRAARAEHVPHAEFEIDGRAADPAWREAPVKNGFIQYDPDEGRPASEETSFRIAYDDSAVYVFVEAKDSSPDQIRGQLTRRDAVSASDWIHLWLDTHDDDRTAYRFSVNPEGVQQDARVVDLQEEDPNWDAVWEVATVTSSQGWSAEFRIPFSQLRYERGHERWGVQVRRDLLRRKEQAYFSPIPKSSDRMVRHFGELNGLAELPSTLGANATPYILARGASDAAVDDPYDLSLDAGADLAIGLGSALTLDLTINPDFAQVEADPSKLNLGTAEIFFEEKRPFFLQSREIFSFPFFIGDGNLAQETLYYSRRIGITPIIAAAQVTGKTSDGWVIGLLDAVIDSGDATPRANAIVARLARELREGQTKIGGLATHQINALDTETRGTHVHQALSGGVDVEHGIGDWRLISRFYASHLDGSSEALEEIQRSPVHNFQRPDADHLTLDPEATALNGWGLTLVGGKFSGKTARGATGVFIKSPGLDTNTLGYLPYADQQIAFGWMQFRDDTKGELHQRWQINLNGTGFRSFGGEHLGADFNINGSWLLPSYWELYAGFGHWLPALDDRFLRGGPAVRYEGGTFGWIGGRTDDREIWTLAAEVFGNINDNIVSGEIGTVWTATLRPASSLEISLSPTFIATVQDTQYYDTPEPNRYLVAHLDQRTLSLVGRVNWTLSPTLSFQVYAAPYLTSGTYDDVRRVVSPRADVYRDRYEPADDPGDQFLFAELRSNVVLRWEYALGSTAFLVWSHEQSDELDDRGYLSVGRDFSTLIGLPSRDALILKVSYWLSI